MSELRVTVPAELVEEIAERSAAIVLERLAEQRAASPFLSVREAAGFLRAEPQRVYDLLSAGRLTRHKDGARVLVSRAELEAHVGRNGAAPALPPSSRSGMGRGPAA